MQRGNPAAYQARSRRDQDEDSFGFPAFEPADGQRGEILADDFEHDTDGEDDHGGADRPHAEEREQAETRDEDGDGLHEPGIPEYEHQLE